MEALILAKVYDNSFKLMVIRYAEDTSRQYTISEASVLSVKGETITSCMFHQGNYLWT
jgi:hypothetical protein